MLRSVFWRKEKGDGKDTETYKMSTTKVIKRKGRKLAGHVARKWVMSAELGNICSHEERQ